MSFTDFTGKEWQCDCLDCALGRADIVPPGGLVFESQDFILHQDPACAIPGFLIASPRRHVRSIAELTVAQRHELMDIVACGIKALHAKSTPSTSMFGCFLGIHGWTSCTRAASCRCGEL